MKVGDAKITFERFVDSGSSFEVPLSKYGKIKFTDSCVEDRVTFLDYIMGGCEIGVHVAIDFTMSNGPPN